MSVPASQDHGDLPAEPRSQPPLARGSWSAMGLSVLVHALLFVVGALWVQRVLPAPEEPDRPASVVAVVTQGERSEYLAFADPATNSAVEPATGSPFPTPDVSNDPNLPALPQSATHPLPAPGIPQAERGGASRPKIATQADYTEWLARERAELQGRIPAGNPVGLSLFGGAPAIGRTFVFLLDRSKSMGGAGLNALEAAAKELEAGLTPLEPVHRFALVAYHHAPVYLDGNRFIEATEQNKRRVAPFLRGLAAFGQTEHQMGLHAALRLKPDVVYLFTDGGDPYLNEAQQAQIQQHAASQRTTIHCIHFGFGPQREADNFLIRLARRNGGGYVYVDMSKQ